MIFPLAQRPYLHILFVSALPSARSSGCFPFTDRDPFIIDDVPDVLLIGNQPHFASTVYRPRDDHQEGGRATRVVLVPRFSKTGEVVLLNLRTKGVKKVTIGWNM